MKNNNHKCKGFTITELAIVLVIMGLLVAGTLGGRELLSLGKLKAVISEIETYQIAVNNFEQQYDGLPGDLSRATSFWAAETVDGNADGHIGTGAVGDDTEVYYAWDQLSLAKIISGSYTGIGTAAITGTNVPSSSHIDGAGYSLSYFASPFSTLTTTTVTYKDSLGRIFPKNYIILGKNHANDNFLSTAIITTDNAHYIDSKIDDGTPDFGSVLSANGEGGGAECTSGSYIYNLTTSPADCIMAFSLE